MTTFLVKGISQQKAYTRGHTFRRHRIRSCDTVVNIIRCVICNLLYVVGRAPGLVYFLHVVSDAQEVAERLRGAFNAYVQGPDPQKS